MQFLDSALKIYVSHFKCREYLGFDYKNTHIIIVDQNSALPEFEVQKL